jgi:hypothetical protein
MRIALTGARAPATFELAHLLRGAGHEVDLVDSVPWAVSRWSQVVGPVWRIPSPRFAPQSCVQALRRLSSQRRWDAILPTCEEIFHLARFVDVDPLALGAPLWAPPGSVLLQLHHKGEFIRSARALSLPVPETHVIAQMPHDTPWEPAAGQGDWVLKPAWSRFGVRVQMLRPGDAWPQEVVPTPAHPWVLQRRLQGQAWCTWSVAREGTLLIHSAYRVEATAGPIGAAIAFTMAPHDRILEWVQRFVSALKLTGQFAFDFIDTAAGPLPLECNPRLTSGVHGFRGDRDAGARVVDAFNGRGAIAEASPSLHHAPDGRRFTSALALRSYGHRIPGGEELLDMPGDRWPHRLQLLSYGWLMALSLLHGADPRAFSTRDIEFNGEGDAT